MPGYPGHSTLANAGVPGAAHYANLYTDVVSKTFEKARAVWSYRLIGIGQAHCAVLLGWPAKECPDLYPKPVAIQVVELVHLPAENPVIVRPTQAHKQSKVSQPFTSEALNFPEIEELIVRVFWSLRVNVID